MMACCVAGGISYIVNDQSELGRAFQDGLHAMANMFIPICGLMASVPFLKVFISKVFGPVFALFGGDPVVAAAIIMPPDCGSFALATEIGQSADLFPVIIAIGFMCASTIAFNVPIGLSMLDKGDHKYLALGTMSGFLSVPFGVFITSVIVMFTHPAIRSTFSSVGEPDHVVVLTLGMLLRNMIPLVVICVLLALGLPHEIAHGSLRLSLCEYNTEEEVDYILEQVPQVVRTLREMSPVWGHMMEKYPNPYAD